MRAALLATVAQVVLFLLAAVAPRPAAAEPRFALRQGAPCAMCHVDPAGGGMRNDYGRGVYSAAKLAADWATPAAGQGVFDGRLSDGVAAGSDVRLLYQHLHRSDADQPRMDSFYLMQAALYVGADLSPSTTLYVAPTFHGGQEVTVAASALVRLPVEGAYIRAGRFTPAYGLKLVNHSTFVRKQLGVGLRAEDAGVELGWDAGPASIQLSAVNGAADGSDGWDDNQLMGFWGRVAHRFGGPRLRLLAGASGGHTVTGLGPDEDPRGDEGRVADQRAGVFGGLSAGRLAWLGEVDLRRYDDLAEERAVTSMVSYQELALIAVRGLEFAVTYELWDPDTTVEDDAVHRVGGGVRLFALVGTELAASYRYAIADSRTGMSGLHEAYGVAHVFF